MELVKELIVTISKLVETDSKLVIPIKGINTHSTNSRILESLFTPLASAYSTPFTMAPQVMKIVI